MPRMKKDEHRAEMIIRGLLKQPENRRCINCDSLGPHYVCTTFWTFVCTNCSGVHREFSHRVKSVSMARFNEEEITALQAGGNERAREIYFKAWDPQRNSLPDNSNTQSLREFIEQVYIDRLYAGANNSTSLSTINKQGSRDSYNEQSSRGVRNDFLRRLSFERTSSSGRDKESTPMKTDNEMDIKSIFEERSPQTSQEAPMSGSNSSRSTSCFEIVVDRLREDASLKNYDRHSNKEPRSGSSSPGSHWGTVTSLPAICPVKVLLGEKALALKVGEPPKASDGKDATDGSARVQKRADGTLPATLGAKQEQNKTVYPSSLEDFNTAPEPTQDKPETQAVVPILNTNDQSSWVASCTNALNMNSIESFFLNWPDPRTSSDSTCQVPAGAFAAQPNSSEATVFGTAKASEAPNSPKALANTVKMNGQQLHSNSQYPMVQMHQIHHLSSEQHDKTFVSPPFGNRNANAPQSATSVAALNKRMQQLNNSPTSNDQRLVKSVPFEQSSQAIGSKDEFTTRGRKELPQDLFTSHFKEFTPGVGSWQYGMQIQPVAKPLAAIMNPSTQGNPFDIGDDRFQVPSTKFPSMTSLQGALPSNPVASALGSQPSPYATVTSHLPQYAMNIPQVPGAYMGQLPNNIPPTWPQGNADFSRSEDAFSSFYPIQQARGTYTFPAPPNYLALQGGNPFG